jgi:hypothetical protein
MNDVVVNYNEKDLFIYFQQLRLLKAKELNDNNVTRTTKVEEEKATLKGTFSNFGKFFERNVKNYKDTGTKIDKDIGVFNARNPVTLSIDTAQELVTSLFKDDKYGLAKLVFATSIILDIEYEYKYVEEGLQEVSQILYGDKDTLLKIKKSFEENYSSINSKPLNNEQIKALLVTGTVLGVMIAVAPFIAIVPVAVASVTAACLISENEKSIKEEFKESSPEKTASYLALQCTYIQRMRESLSEDEIKEELDALLKSVDSIKADLDYYLFVERESIKENKEKLKIFHRFDDRLVKVLNIEK